MDKRECHSKQQSKITIEPRVLIICENASFRFGGEASLPLHYFTKLRERNIETWLIVHERVRQELAELLGNEFDRVSFIPNTLLHKLLHNIAMLFPEVIGKFTFGQAMLLWSQYLARQIAKELILHHRINVIHQPTPVSPKNISLNNNLGVPLVIGPLNGGMNYPPGFINRHDIFSRFFLKIGRQVSDLCHRFVSGKLEAEMILVANQRTYDSLPSNVKGNVKILCENGIDTQVWHNLSVTNPEKENVRVIYVGRLVKWKGVDLLIEACTIALREVQLELEIVGEGEFRHNLELLADNLKINDRVKFFGWLTQLQCAQRMVEADIFVLPSLYECGGAVILEAMAMKLPVIATRWGGPTDYLDDSCGILIEPDSREIFIDQLAQSIIKLSKNYDLRRTMGDKSRQKVINEFDWQKKVEQMIEIYQITILQHTATV